MLAISFVPPMRVCEPKYYLHHRKASILKHVIQGVQVYEIFPINNALYYCKTNYHFNEFMDPFGKVT